MSKPTLVIGNKAYSSWSLRPWVFMRHHGIEFDEVRVPLYVDGAKEKILARSPSGKVPALIDGDTTVWDSLAILEYLAERHPHAQGWPADVAARALARSVCAEMHSGFPAMRQSLSMNCRKVYAWRDWPDDVLRDVERVQAIWAACRMQHGQGGPFLFGRFSIADAMYAPVVWRFTGYSVPLSDTAREYCDAMLALPAMRAWRDEARTETEVLAQFERDL